MTWETYPFIDFFMGRPKRWVRETVHRLSEELHHSNPLENYIGMHVRYGDKLVYTLVRHLLTFYRSETPNAPPFEKYMSTAAAVKKMLNVTSLTIYLATDDANVVEAALTNYTEVSIFI